MVRAVSELTSKPGTLGMGTTGAKSTATSTRMRSPLLIESSGGGQVAEITELPSSYRMRNRRQRSAGQETDAGARGPLRWPGQALFDPEHRHVVDVDLLVVLEAVDDHDQPHPADGVAARLGRDGAGRGDPRPVASRGA